MEENLVCVSTFINTHTHHQALVLYIKRWCPMGTSTVGSVYE
jgi:hypothetical protein